VKGLDVPENALLLDATFADDRGAPYVHPGAVAVCEVDAGLLWKHFDETSRQSVARRGRNLVISYLATLGNYDYGFNWIFHQDGAIEVRIDLTGSLLAKAVASTACANCRPAAGASATGPVEPRGDQRYGTLVDKGLVGTNHQHFFNFRLDLDVDGVNNSVAELNVRAVQPGDDNPLSNAFIQEETFFGREAEARRTVDPVRNRHWKVFNPSVRSALGHFTAYLLEPHENAPPLVGRDTILRRRAGFLNHHVWVTREHTGELHAAGDYPRQNTAGDGLPRFSGDESIENKDLVLWYTLGVTHIARPEDWPVMPVAHAGFRLVPAGFFSRNPALDVPE
jgi:primary-amine oxidase